MNLTIISHTEHYKKADGTLVGLGSTVTEINHLLEVFDSITHVAMLHKGSPPPNALPYISDKIRFVALPMVGGHTLKDKFGILQKAPSIVRIIKKELGKSDYFQFRAPTGIGVFVIPYLILFTSKKGWFKYAGNWKQEHAPFAYRFQRWLLKKQKRFVTINGYWNYQPRHCLTFENPCLTEKDISNGQSVIKNKHLKKKTIQLCFVGRLEEAKGLGILIEGVEMLSKAEKEQLEMVHIVGDGAARTVYETQALRTDVPFKFHGFLSRFEVHEIYTKSHAVLLPSASEGFPKVIAEAINYGCLPIVSNVSSISHYIVHEENGFLLDTIDATGVFQALKQFLQLTATDYSIMLRFQENNMKRFTYNYYNERIVNDIL